MGSRRHFSYVPAFTVSTFRRAERYRVQAIKESDLSRYEGYWHEMTDYLRLANIVELICNPARSTWRLPNAFRSSPESGLSCLVNIQSGHSGVQGLRARLGHYQRVYEDRLRRGSKKELLEDAVDRAIEANGAGTALVNAFGGAVELERKGYREMRRCWPCRLCGDESGAA